MDKNKFTFSFVLTATMISGLAIFLYSPQSISAQCEDIPQEEKIENQEAYRDESLRRIEECKNEIKQYEDKIEEKKKEQKTLNRELSIIEQEVKKYGLELKKTKLYIEQLRIDIQSRNKEISDLEKKALLEKIKLAEHLSKINEYDKIGVLEMMLNYGNFSDFFANATAMENLQNETQRILGDIRGIKNDLEVQIEMFKEDQKESIYLKSILESQNLSLAQKQKEKKNLVAQTKGQEKKFQELVVKNKKKIIEIQSRLFGLSNALGVGKITIEKAIEYAEFAAQKTGIRPAFLLGLIWVESRLNSNLGTGNWKTDLYDCYIRLGKKSAAEMQKNAFFEITGKLMLNPDNVPVSKALTSVGCGGAMGIAQFMPATWQGYESKISLLSGNNPASPWNILDGFTGSAVKLSDNGAGSQNREGERKAAAMYYAGSRWQRAPGQNYATRVREASFCYQDYIDAVKKGEQNIDIESNCEKYF